MNKQCPQCGLNNPYVSKACIRCGRTLIEVENISSNQGLLKSGIVKRAGVCLLVLVAVILGFYTSLIFSADKLRPEEQAQVDESIRVLEEKGFHDEAYLLKHLAVFRGNDNWLNASVAKENAYAATNFPFEIVTLYPDFFTYPFDSTERAAILLHEAKHLEGKGEKDAYEYVWKNRKRLGWTHDAYHTSAIWTETRKLTRELASNLFVCEFNNYGDCTE